MSAMIRWGMRTAAAGAAVTLVALAAFPAGADEGFGGGADGQDIYASAIHYDESKNGTGGKTGALTPAGNWTPPACWYEPKYTPEQLKKHLEPVWNADSTGSEWDAKQREKYEGGKPYKDFNKDKKGMWWDGVVDHSRAGDPGFLDCQDGPFWVDQGDTPDVPNSVTPEMLAELAYGRLRVPDTEVSLSPQNRQTVNVPTWAWLDQGTFKPVSVTASLDSVNMSATTTATPISLHLEPGTSDATLHPGSGECAIKDGSIGSAYVKGSGDKTPPCGMTYLRANTHTGPYKFKATITWKVAWTSTDGGGATFPSGTFGTTTDVTVQEVQAINR